MKNIEKNSEKNKEFNRDQMEFIGDLSACAELAKLGFATDKVSPQAVFAIYDAVGAPDELSPREREQVVADLNKSASWAKEWMKNDPEDKRSLEDFALLFFYLFTIEREDDGTVEDAYYGAAAMAKRSFGDKVPLEAVIEVFERYYGAEAEDEDEDEEEDETDDED